MPPNPNQDDLCPHTFDMYLYLASPYESTYPMWQPHNSRALVYIALFVIILHVGQVSTNM